MIKNLFRASILTLIVLSSNIDVDTLPQQELDHLFSPTLRSPMQRRHRAFIGSVNHLSYILTICARSLNENLSDLDMSSIRCLMKERFEVPLCLLSNENLLLLIIQKVGKVGSSSPKSQQHLRKIIFISQREVNDAALYLNNVKHSLFSGNSNGKLASGIGDVHIGSFQCENFCTSSAAADHATVERWQ